LVIFRYFASPKIESAHESRTIKNLIGVQETTIKDGENSKLENSLPLGKWDALVFSRYFYSVAFTCTLHTYMSIHIFTEKIYIQKNNTLIF
jgi:hypothetical protein